MSQNPTSRFQLGAMTLPYLRWPFDRALEGIARAGFRVVGIRPGHGDAPLLPENPTAADFRTLRRRVDRHGLTSVLMFAQRGSDGWPVDLCKDVEIVAQLGMPFLLDIPVSPSPRFASESAGRIGEMTWFTRVEEWFRRMMPAVRRAEQRGVTILLKPHGGIGGTGEDLALIVKRLDSASVRVLYDPGNVVYYEGVRPERDVASVADLVRALAIKDHRGGRAAVDFPTPGDGDIDHATIFRTLSAAGFNGPCLIERIDGLTTAEDVDAELARGRVYLERVVAEVTAS